MRRCSYEFGAADVTAGKPRKNVSNFLIVHLAEVSIVKPYRTEFLVVLQAHDLVGFLA